MIIRPMKPEDMTSVLPIEKACFTDPWSEDGFMDSMKETSAHLIVIEDEPLGIVGYACLYQAADEGEIVNVAIHPSYRQKGYGARLVQALLQLGRELGAERFFLEVRKGNNAGRALYTSLGFTECGVRKGFYDNPKEDAVLMMWEETGVSQ